MASDVRKLRPVTYAEIVLANRRRPVVSGWRGQPVMGGGRTIKSEAPILASEIPRMSTTFKAVDMRRKRIA